MIVLDVNVLLPAFRAENPHHERVRSWLTSTFAAGEPIGVPDVVWVGFIRICTNPRIFTAPSGTPETLAFVRAFAAQPGYVHLGGLSDGIEPLLTTVEAAGAAGNLATDAYIAAIALSLAASVATFDRDFRRFDGLRVVELPA